MKGVSVLDVGFVMQGIWFCWCITSAGEIELNLFFVAGFGIVNFEKGKVVSGLGMSYVNGKSRKQKLFLGKSTFLSRFTRLFKDVN